MDSVKELLHALEIVQRDVEQGTLIADLAEWPKLEGVIADGERRPVEHLGLAVLGLHGVFGHAATLAWAGPDGLQNITPDQSTCARLEGTTTRVNYLIQIIRKPEPKDSTVTICSGH